MNFTFTIMTVTPDHKFFEQKEKNNASEDRGKYPKRFNVFKSMWYHPEKGCAKQRACGVTDKTRHECFSHPFRKKQEKCGTCNRPDTPEHTKE
jgi:hypothetical protein